MNIRILLAAFIVTMIINNVNSQGYSMSNGQSRQLGSRGYRPTNYQAAGADFGQQYNPSGQQYGQNERIDPTNQKAEYPTQGVLGSAAGFVSKKIRQTITLIKCVLKCFMQRFTVNLCYQMFPCLYDCFIGQEYIPNDIETQIQDIENSRGLVFPSAVNLKSIYTMIKCIYSCATERQIRNWETFAYSLYCFADSCICYKIFNTNG